MQSKVLNFILIGLISIMITACSGGGGGDASNASNDSAGYNNQASSKDFSVELGSIVITRVSNGDAVEVDISDVSSDTLTLVSATQS